MITNFWDNLISKLALDIHHSYIEIEDTVRILGQGEVEWRRGSRQPSKRDG
jgi:hypothetical protein